MPAMPGDGELVEIAGYTDGLSLRATVGTIILAALPIVLGFQWPLTVLVLNMLYQSMGRF